MKKNENMKKIGRENMDLQKRIEQFRELEYAFNKDFYQELKEEHSPHTLFIGCSDSRVKAETLFQAEAGEIFQVRNIANIVPRKEEPDDHTSVVSAIEYAVITLKVKNIVVCGHSNCGGCAAIRKLEEYRKELPYTGEWISQSISISDYIDDNYPDMKEEDKIIMLEKLNTVQQLDNLMTYGFVRKRFESGKLNLHAYYYDIGTGSISVYDYDSVFSDMIAEITANRKLLVEEQERERELERQKELEQEQADEREKENEEKQKDEKNQKIEKKQEEEKINKEEEKINKEEEKTNKEEEIINKEERKKEEKKKEKKKKSKGEKEKSAEENGKTKE